MLKLVTFVALLAALLSVAVSRPHHRAVKNEDLTSSPPVTDLISNEEDAFLLSRTNDEDAVIATEQDDEPVYVILKPRRSGNNKKKRSGRNRVIVYNPRSWDGRNRKRNNNNLGLAGAFFYVPPHTIPSG
uniref:Putative secretory peptide-58 n=1 Tax=Pleurobrachia bachei TaxID=34499 RepID=M4H1S0_PLEBA|nr:putative secretory peptide-58 [Pleurobrachia bachei]|eukprot:sb/3475219/